MDEDSNSSTDSLRINLEALTDDIANDSEDEINPTAPIPSTIEQEDDEDNGDLYMEIGEDIENLFENLDEDDFNTEDLITNEERREREILEQIIEEIEKREEGDRKEIEKTFEKNFNRDYRIFNTIKLEKRNCGFVLSSDCVSASMHYSGNYVNFPRGNIGAVKDTIGNYVKIGSVYRESTRPDETTLPQNEMQDHPISYKLYSQGETPMRKTAINDVRRLRYHLERTERSELSVESVDVLNKNLNILGEGNSSICTHCGCSHERNLAPSCYTKMFQEITGYEWDLNTTGEMYDMFLEGLAKILGRRDPETKEIKVDGTFGYYHWADQVQEKLGNIAFYRNHTIKQTRFEKGERLTDFLSRPEKVKMSRRDFIGELNCSKMINKDEKRSEESRAIACFSFFTMAWQVATELVASTRTTNPNEAGLLKNEEAYAKVEEVTSHFDIEATRNPNVRVGYLTTDCTKYNNTINIFEMALHTILKTLNESLETTLYALFSHAFCGCLRTVKAPKVPVKKNGVLILTDLLSLGKQLIVKGKNLKVKDFDIDFKTKNSKKVKGEQRRMHSEYVPFFKGEAALWATLIFQTHRLSDTSDLMLDLGQRMGMGVFNLTATSSQEWRILKMHEELSEGLTITLLSTKEYLTIKTFSEIVENFEEMYLKNPIYWTNYYTEYLEKAKKYGPSLRHRLVYTGKSDDGYQVFICPKKADANLTFLTPLFCMEASNRVVSAKKSVGTFSGDGNIYSSPVANGQVFTVPSKFYNSFFPQGKNPLTDEENMQAMVGSSLKEQVPLSITMSHVLNGLGAFQGVWKSEWPHSRMSKEGERICFDSERAGLRSEIRPLIFNGKCVTTADTCHSSTLVTRLCLTKTQDEELMLFDPGAEEPTSVVEIERGKQNLETSSLYKALGSFNTRPREPKRVLKTTPISKESREALKDLMLQISSYNRTSRKYGDVLLELAVEFHDKEAKSFLEEFGFSIQDNLDEPLASIKKRDALKKRYYDQAEHFRPKKFFKK